MPPPPDYQILTFRDADRVPAGAEELFASQLAEARARRRGASPTGDAVAFVLVCAVAPGGRVLGGVQIDLTSLGGAGPLASSPIAYLERTLVRPEFRRQSLATRLLRHALRVAADAGCLYVRCSNNWDNEPERRLLLACGFALVDIDGEADPEPCYLAVRPLDYL